MNRLFLALGSLLVLAVIASGAFLWAIAPSSEEIGELKQELRLLRQDQQAMRERLSTLSQMLQYGQPQRRRQAVTVGTDGAAARGSDDAPVTIVEFSDFQCPFCRRHFRAAMPKLIDDYVEPGTVRYVVRDFPLEVIHPAAFGAAVAARCAGEQGSYWAMHDRLFEMQETLPDRNWVGHAEGLGLDTARFRSCLDNEAVAAAVRRDQSEAANAGATGTPTFFVGRSRPGESTIRASRVIRGAQPYRVFEQAIEAVLSTEPAS